MRIRALLVALLSAALSGCWVLDELSDGNKKMDAYTKAKEAKPGDGAGGEPAAGGGGKRMRANEYFASQTNARHLTPGTVSKEIVSCKLKSGTQFMKESECAARGGTAKR
jgi:hypothetical protein